MEQQIVAKETWKAESDAYTLAEARRIEKDSERMNAAVKVADRLAKEAQERADSLDAIDNRRSLSSTKSSTKPATKNKKKVVKKKNLLNPLA